MNVSSAFSSGSEDVIVSSAKKKAETVFLLPAGLAAESFESSYISPWVFPVHTLDLVESYTPFIFRTKKSAAIDELKVLINVDNKGRISGYEVLNEGADKGLVERVGHVVRNMPRAQAIPGFDRYDAMDFELVIKK